MAAAAAPLRTPSGVIVPTDDSASPSDRALITSALLTLGLIGLLGGLSLWSAPIAFLAAGAGAGYSLSGSV